jgi:glycogen phosphorylase
MPVSRTTPSIPCVSVADIELPARVEKLYDLAYNFWWSWNLPARWLFADVDRWRWERYKNPVELLINVEPTHWDALLESEAFMASYTKVVREFEAFVDRATPTWFDRHYPEYQGGPVAYLSMEYGLHQSLAVYSGGLGILSGDHCKSASDLGLPFVAIGLLYRHGYFRQTIDSDGRQQHTYPDYDFARLPVRPAATRTGKAVLVSVPLPGREVHVKVWVAEVGRVPLLLLDTDVPQNDPADRPITGSLYVSGREMRLVQEIVLGVGGVKALEALGIEPSVWHMNEGHCAMMQFERLRRAFTDEGKDRESALAAVRASSVFTTHTPVPAGNEIFDPALVARYLGPWATSSGFSSAELLALGDASQATGDGGFNLTAVALETCRTANAVSQLNADVTNRMWGPLLEAHPSGPQEIFGITNGIHSSTWLGREMRDLFRRHIGPDWTERVLNEEPWAKIAEVPDADIWQAHQAQKARLGRFARNRCREQFARHGRSPDELRLVENLFDDNALTIGFARRFATYKRANLILSDLDRLVDLLVHEERPVQILFAGKAHPADRPGQELIQQIFTLSQSADLRGRILFLEDYDMLVGRRMVQGVDVWLNTPRRPMEASGTSGQKAAMNGALNVSILDGWWPEGFDGGNGWAIGGGADSEELANGGNHKVADHETDREDADALYTLIEQEVVPIFYDRDEHGVPHRWVERMKHAIATITPRFSSARMVRDYAERSYFPR